MLVGSLVSTGFLDGLASHKIFVSVKKNPAVLHKSPVRT